MTFKNEQEIVEFANRAFEYLNGKVNIIPAKLYLRTNFNIDLLANNIFNMVNLYIWNIIKYCKNDINYIKESIVVNIVHELSHIGQDIDYKKYNTDENYKLMKENENNYNTYKYLFYNICYIVDSLGMTFNASGIYDNYNYYSRYTSYNKYSQKDYYKQCIKTILNNDINANIYNDIDEMFNSQNAIFSINEIAIIQISKFEICIDNTCLNSILENYNNFNSSVSESIICRNENAPILLKSNIKFLHCFNNGK